MKASVIITTYKRPVYLKRAIKSVLNQTCTDFEIIVVDDNGVGNIDQISTAEVIGQFIETNIIYLPLSENCGACLARNKGVEVASGEFIFFLDDDDEYLPDKLKFQIEYLNDNLKFDGCLTGFKRVDNNGDEIISEANFPITGTFKNFVIAGNFFTPMLCIRRSSIIRVGGFQNISRFQDRYLMLRCLQQNCQFKDFKEQLYIMHEHAGDRVTNKSIDKSIKSLNILKNYIDKFRYDFTDEEYTTYLLKDDRMRATIYYVGRRRWLSFKSWLIISFKTKSYADLSMTLKSYLKK